MPFSAAGGWLSVMSSYVGIGTFLKAGKASLMAAPFFNIVNSGTEATNKSARQL
jgi:hypothetical protein